MVQLFFQLQIDGLEQNLESMYQTWENLLLSIRNINDITQFQRTFDQSKNFFEAELNKKEQYISAYKAQNYKELIKNNEHLKNLQNQYFASSATKQLAIIEQNIKAKLTTTRHTNIMQAEIKLKTIYNRFVQKLIETIDSLQNIFMNLAVQQIYENQQNGLTPTSIRSFHVFLADETHVGNQCCICMEDICVGRRMRRLTCDGQHYFCQECIEGWFAEHNTCPLCRHLFD